MRGALREQSTGCLRLALVILVMSGMVLFLQLRQFQEQNQWVWHTQTVLEQSEGLLSLVKDAETGQRGYLLTGDEHYLQPYTTSAQVIQSNLQALRQLTADNPTQQSRINAVEPLLTARLAELRETIELNKSKGLEAALQVVRTNQGLQLMEKLRQLIGEIKAQENKLLDKQLVRAQSTTRVMSLAIIVCGSLTVSLVALASVLLNRDRIKRQRAELKLRESEQRLTLALKAAKLGSWQLDLTTGELYASDQCKKNFGLSPEADLSYKALFERIHPDDRVYVQESVKSALGQRIDYEAEYRNIWLDGSIHWVLARGRGVYESDGCPSRMIGVTLNITDRKLAEEALRVSEEQLRMALESAHLGIWNWNLLTNKITWSSSHEQLFGLEPGTFDGTYETFLAYLHPDDRDAVNQAMNRAILERTDYYHKYRIIWTNGSARWIEGKVRALYNETGQALRMTGTVMDISERQAALWERKQAEEALQQQVEQQQLVLEIAQRVRQSLNLKKILNTTVEEVRQFLRTDRALIFRFEPDWKGRVVVESVDAEWTSILSTTIHDPCIGEHYVEFFKQGQVTAKADIYTSKINPCHLELLTYFQVRANLVVPILQGENLWGLLVAHHCRAPRQWQQSEIDLLQQLATQVGIAIQQSTLFEQVQAELIERRRTEEALRQSEQKFRQLTESIREVFFIYPLDYSQLLYVSPAYETIWGNSCESLYRKPNSWLDSIHPDDRERLMAALQRQSEGEEFYQEYRIFHPDGSIRWLLGRNFFIRNEAGQIYRVAGLAEDISDRKLAEQALLQAKDELEIRVQERTAELSNALELLQRELQERQQVEQALRQANQRITNILESITDAFIALDREWKITYVNREAARFNQKNPEEFLGKTYWEVWPWSVGTQVEQEYCRALSEQVAVHLEVLHESLGRWLEIHAYPSVDGLAIYFRDISDRKIAEEERAKLIDILEATSDFIATTSLDRQVHYLNGAARKLFGWGQDQDLANFSTIDAYPDWAFEIVRNKGVPVAVRDGVWVGETALLNHSGQEIPISQLIIAHKGKDGSVNLISTIARDITQQKQVEATLREAERRWRSLLENVRLLVVILDNTGNVEFANPFFLELTGYTQAEVQGKDWFQTFLPWRGRQPGHPAGQAVLEQEFHPHCHNKILTKSSEERLIAWNNTQLQNLQGEVIGTMSIGEDITERHAIEKMKNEFISIVSHELRTPLTAIRGSLGILATGALKNYPERMQRMIEIATIDTERLVRLVNDILDLERLDSGRVTLVKEYCDAAALMIRSAEAMRSLAEKENIILSTSPVHAQVWASGDHIIQTLTNLLSNAIKFSPPNSTITLTAQPQVDYVLFKVKDQGRGIPPDKLETIFGRFQQVDASDSRQKGGTGLGLAICRSIIVQHGGCIWAESVLGEGSTLCFTLPTFSELTSPHPANLMLRPTAYSEPWRQSEF